MHEHGAAASGNARMRIVVDFEDEIVKVIIAPEPVAWCVFGQADRAVISAIVRVFAPSVGTGDAAHRQVRRWTSDAIRTPPKAERPKVSAWRCTIALALISLNPITAECDRHSMSADS